MEVYLYPRSDADLSKTWQSSINSHHAAHFGLIVVQCQVFRPLLCLLVMIKTVVPPKPIPILFFFLSSQETPGAQLLVIFY